MHASTITGMGWSAYVQRYSGGDTNRVIAQKVGVTEPAVSRWKTGRTEQPDAKQAASFARAYRRPVLEAFVAAGFLTADEAGERPGPAAPDANALSNDELLSVLRSRLQPAPEDSTPPRVGRVGVRVPKRSGEGRPSQSRADAEA